MNELVILFPYLPLTLKTCRTSAFKQSKQLVVLTDALCCHCLHPVKLVSFKYDQESKTLCDKLCIFTVSFPYVSNKSEFAKTSRNQCSADPVWAWKSALGSSLA